MQNVARIANEGGSTPAGGPAESAAGLSAVATPSAVPAKPSEKSAYPAPASRPTQSGPAGIFYDFNEGCRVQLPIRETGVWRVRLRDLDTGNILFESENKGGLIRSSKRWFVRFGIEVWSKDDESAEPNLVFEHHYDATGRDILILIPAGTLGDAIAWLSYATRFPDCHPGVRVTIVLSKPIADLFRRSYPDIRFVTMDEVAEESLTEKAYATYALGLFFTDVASDWQPTDFRHVGLHKTAGYILGTNLEERPPVLALEEDARTIAEPYAVIAVQSTSGAKYWNNPHGWAEIIAFLKARGYRVLCVDQKKVHGHGLMWTHMPHGAEDMTGLSLAECARLMKHADVFVGLSSGLSWLAWAAGCPVVLISGFSHPSTEFQTPYRVINWHTCNSCWNDPTHVFDHKDFLWCPRHANTPRQFECTRLITPAHVMRVIESIPRFASQAATPMASDTRHP